VIREPVSFFERLPIKARVRFQQFFSFNHLKITTKRLNANEKVGVEVSLFVGSAQVALTARHLSHVTQWAEALSEAFIREDLKDANAQPIQVCCLGIAS
jgi:hypothetical protein